MFVVCEINFRAGSIGSSAESSSILLIASSHWNIPGRLIRKVPRNPAGKLSRKLLLPLPRQLHDELLREVGRRDSRKLARKKKDPSDTPMQFSTRLFTHYSRQRSTSRSMGRASQNSMQLSTGRPARRSIAQYAQITTRELLTMLRCKRHANFYAHAFRRSYHDNTYMEKFRSNIKKNKTISTRCSAESFARTPMQP